MRYTTLAILLSLVSGTAFAQEIPATAAPTQVAATPVTSAPVKQPRGYKFKICGQKWREIKTVEATRHHNWMDFIQVCAKKDQTPDTAAQAMATLP